MTFPEEELLESFPFFLSLSPPLFVFKTSQAEEEYKKTFSPSLIALLERKGLSLIHI